MKKILLGSTALLGAGLLSASAAAQVELQISGYAQFEAGIVDEDGDAGADRDYDFRQDGWIQFNARGVADNGLEYGAEIELDDIAAGEIEQDEQYVYIAGDFGTVRFGDKEGPAKEFAVTAPIGFGSGGFDGNYTQYTLGQAGAYLLDVEEALDSDNTKITYLTPEIGGFQGGIGFAPADAAGKPGTHRTAADSDLENILTAGFNYSADFQGFEVLAGVGGIWGGGVDTDDLTGFNIGLNVGFGGITVGGAYVLLTDVPGDLDEHSTWQIGAQYEFGPWTVGANAAFDTREFEVGGDSDTQIYSAGATYALAPGLAVYGDITFVDADATPTDPENEATVLLVGTSVAF